MYLPLCGVGPEKLRITLIWWEYTGRVKVPRDELDVTLFASELGHSAVLNGMQ